MICSLSECKFGKLINKIYKIIDVDAKYFFEFLLIEIFNFNCSAMSWLISYSR